VTSHSSKHTDAEEQEPHHGTPPDLVRELARPLPGGTFSIDPTGRPEWERREADGAEAFCDVVLDEASEPDGLRADWGAQAEGGAVIAFYNPPYGRHPVNPRWATKLREQLGWQDPAASRLGGPEGTAEVGIDGVVAVLPLSGSAGWFGATYARFDHLAFCDRLKFVHPDNFAPAGFDSVIAAHGALPPGYPEALAAIDEVSVVRSADRDAPVTS
jgi:hypothetical protein